MSYQDRVDRRYLLTAAGAFVLGPLLGACDAKSPLETLPHTPASARDITPSPEPTNTPEPLVLSDGYNPITTLNHVTFRDRLLAKSTKFPLKTFATLPQLNPQAANLKSPFLEKSEADLIRSFGVTSYQLCQDENSNLSVYFKTADDLQVNNLMLKLPTQSPFYLFTVDEKYQHLTFPVSNSSVTQPEPDKPSEGIYTTFNLNTRNLSGVEFMIQVNAGLFKIGRQTNPVFALPSRFIISDPFNPPDRRQYQL